MARCSEETFEGAVGSMGKRARHFKLLDNVGQDEKGLKRPPFNGRDLLDYLVEIGILRRRGDERIDAPDLLLAGLGLKRKGGVRRRA